MSSVLIFQGRDKKTNVEVQSKKHKTLLFLIKKCCYRIQDDFKHFWHLVRYFQMGFKHTRYFEFKNISMQKAVS